VLYISERWLDAHAADITAEHPTGTGEYDLAFLVVDTSSVTSPAQVSASTAETREGATFENDSVLVASYPAGFAGGITIQTGLSLVSTITTIQRLYTFTEGTIDLFSLGGVINAQSGSSGGGVFNQWGKLVGIVTTSSDAAQTKDRDLRALSLAYIEKELRDETGKGLSSFTAPGASERAENYRSDAAPHLAKILTVYILPAH